MKNKIVVAALYKFVRLEDYVALQHKIRDFLAKEGICGTILLAEEGINGTIAGTRAGMDNVLAFLRSDPRLVDLDHKESFCEETPFHRLKIKLKREIVTLGQPEVDPNRVVGTYVDPQDWNSVISDPEIVVIDTRNDYEYAIGTFKRAIDPKIQTFREFPNYVEVNLNPEKHPKVAMFCTGGIRCEKASSYMLQKGFKEIYHIKGGILKYLETVPEEESMWDGECFVFDNRVSVGHGLAEGRYDQCYGCRHPITEEEKASPEYWKGVSCPHCFNSLISGKAVRFAQRQRQVELAKSRNMKHIGA